MNYSNKFYGILRNLADAKSRGKRNPIGVAYTFMNVYHSLDNYGLPRAEKKLIKEAIETELKEIKAVESLNKEFSPLITEWMKSRESWSAYKNKWNII